MANLTETAVWEDGIYQFEEEDLVQGGADGIDNVQAKQLGNRTVYLKALVEALGLNKQDAAVTLAALATLIGAADKLAYFTGANSAALTSFTAFARTLLAAADDDAARTLLGAVTQADINSAVAALVNSSPAALDTLNEFAVALGNDPNFATTITNLIAAKAPLASPVLTGIPTAPTAVAETNTTQLATTAFVRAAVVALNLSAYAKLAASNVFTKGNVAQELALPATAGVVTLDLALANNFGGTLTGNITLANPANMVAGQSGIVRIVNGAAPYTIAYGAFWKSPGGVMPALTAVAGAVDIFGYYVESATRITLIQQADSK